jgi:hypothetical protein
MKSQRRNDMKTVKSLFAILMLLLTVTSCSKDGDNIYLSSPEGGTLTATTSDVVLAKSLRNTIVLSLAWTQSDLKVSDASMSAPNVLQTKLQVSATQDFSGAIQESSESALSKAYTGSELNTLAKNLGLTAGNAAPLYFRLSVKTGDNMTPVYSNVVAVNITAYTIDMTVGFVLDSKKADTGNTLYSATANGVYQGFLGAGAWYNFFLMEGDDTTWGNDGVDGTAFLCSSADTKWNFWFPGQKGCYYTTVDTPNKKWSALYIPKLTVSGDLEGDMTFDKDSDRWTLDFTATAAGTKSIKISGTSSLYNYDTGTDDTKAVAGTVGFGGTSDHITFGTSASDITVTVPSAGTYSLTLNLKNPKQWTCTAEKPYVAPVTVSKYLYVSGVDDGTSGSWTFNNFLTLYSEDAKAYEGVVSVNSLWGYKFYTTSGDWNSSYGMVDGGTATSGSIVAGGNNITAPTAGLYLFDVSMTNLTYSLTEVTKVCYAGFNTTGDAGGNWTMTEMTPTSTPGEYTAQVTLAGTCSWGAKIYINGSWDIFFGGSDGTMYYKGDGMEKALGAGTYTLTVNLKTMTYTMK